MECLESNKVCPANNLKCKECKLTECKNALKVLEDYEMYYIRSKEEKFYQKLEKEFPSCVDCSQLEIINMDQYNVRCPYMINKRCIIKD